ncbi:MAG: septal ring lytic transglycosylase RlpA family protein [Candidatus Delongbacteria bacterium]|nr:septal ring lytic transglycosylase RlpA family protein [Candidatus Delongbacteria bacterium]MBN2837050.1 septal ring lytic transglycosylase RlpA family protein [Candidatus Delongbacteria bacterium]
MESEKDLLINRILHIALIFIFSCSPVIKNPNKPKSIKNSQKIELKISEQKKENEYKLGSFLNSEDTYKTIYMNASFYGSKFHGKKTASGEMFDMYKMTAAHKTLPFGTELLVTSLDTKKSVKVVVNDRGPFISGRDLDLSYAAAKELGIINKGHGMMEVKVLNSK